MSQFFVPRDSLGGLRGLNPTIMEGEPTFKEMGGEGKGGRDEIVT